MSFILYLCAIPASAFALQEFARRSRDLIAPWAKNAPLWVFAVVGAAVPPLGALAACALLLRGYRRSAP